MYDCHVHSEFSGDSEMPVDTACETAIKIGLEGIAFTDHLDYDFPNCNIYENIDFNKYSEYMDLVKARYAPSLNVIKGIEIGIQPHVIDRTIKVVESYDFDYVLASIHIVEGLDPYEPVYFEGVNKKSAYDRYLKSVLFMIKKINNYDAIGHTEFITRHAIYSDRSMYYKDHAELFDEIFKILIASGKGLEVNTSAYRDKDGIATPVYDINVLKRYRELGGEIISLSSDAHNPYHIGYKFNEFKEILQQAGFKYTAHFEARKPVFDKL